jgi:hypothetical protein
MAGGQPSTQPMGTRKVSTEEFIAAEMKRTHHILRAIYTHDILSVFGPGDGFDGAWP